MKKLTMLFLAFLLTGCAASAPEQASAEPVKTPEETEAPQEETDKAILYQQNLEEYEDLEIALLGAVDEAHYLQDILNRAASAEGMGFISAIPEEKIFYGTAGEYRDYVYLIVPHPDTEVTVGTYNYYAGEIVEPAAEKMTEPFIYVESGDTIDPAGMITYVKHFPQGESPGEMYTGVTADGKLRTEFHMGVVDITVYDAFDPGEIPFYAQFLFDTLQSYEEISGALSEGKTLDHFGEYTWEGHIYESWGINDDTGLKLYNIYYDPVSGYTEVLTSTDSGSTWQPLGRG